MTNTQNSKDETEHRAREVAHRLLTTPPKPKLGGKGTSKPTPANSGASKQGKRARAGVAS